MANEMDKETVREVLMDGGVSGELLDAMTEGCLDMERWRRRKVCVNYVDWLCGGGRCEACRSYDDGNTGQLELNF